MPFWQVSTKLEDCPQCPVIKDQLAELLETINSMQADLDTVRHDRRVYEESCMVLRNDLRDANEKFFQQKQQINEWREKVRLYQECNEQLFDKCAGVHDLEGEVKSLTGRVKELEEINWRGGGGARPSGNALLEADTQTDQTPTYHQQEPHAGEMHAPSRATAIDNLAKVMQGMPDFLKSPTFSPSISSGNQTDFNY